MATAPTRQEIAPVSRRLAVVADRLARVYGVPQRRRRDPLSELVMTVLSQATSDLNSGRAYRDLTTAFPTWEAASRAGARRITRAIRVGGLARTKGRRIAAILDAVRRREGCLDLRSLRRLSPVEADRRLCGLPGVGRKTRACVLLFACGHPAFPVDTHVHRIVRRLGLVPDRASAEAAHDRLAPAVPAQRALDLHLNLIRLGREVCRPRDPRCAACPLRRVCLHAREAA
jgi:endonuclease-3